MQGKLTAVVNTYWRNGVVLALVLFDIMVLAVCISDVWRFSHNGRYFSDAVKVATQIMGNDRSLLILAVEVLLFFLGLPVFAAFIGHFRPTETWPKLLGTKGVTVLIAHVVGSIAIAYFSSVAQTMEVLSGWSKVVEGRTLTVEYSFFSIWLLAVFWCKFFSVAYLSPIAKKIMWRIAGGERHEKGSTHSVVIDTAKEVLTEHGLKEEH